MSLLTIVQDHCRIYALNVPQTVVGSQDTTIKQIWGLMNDMLDDLEDQSNWQGYTFQCVFPFVAGEDQGDLKTITNDVNYKWFHNETFYDRSLMRPVYGPVTDVEWQQLKAIPNPGPWYKYRILQDHLLINPAPTVGNLSTVAFEYQSGSGVIDGTTEARKNSFTLDTDKTVLPERLFKKYLAYRWKEIKQIPFQGEMDRYYSMLNNYIARDGSKGTFNMAHGRWPEVQPGIFVPSGNWPVR